jgi:NitT/TauT family transport system permease protein
MQTVLTFVGLVVLWEVCVDLFNIRPYILPAPSAIGAALIKFHDKLLTASIYTIRSIGLGYAMAVIFGVLMALPIALSSLMQRTIYPVMVLTQIVPKVALAPIFVIWFGFSLTPKVAVVFLLSFFPVVLNGIVGLRSIDPEILHLTRSTGASRWDTFFKVRLPFSLPNFFAGFKLAAISAAVGGIIGEFIGSDSGLGYVILTANGDLHTDLSFAAILCITVIGLILYYAVELIEHMMIPWHVSQRGVGSEMFGV